MKKCNPGKIVCGTLNEMEEWRIVIILKKGVTVDPLKSLDILQLITKCCISEKTIVG